MISLATVVQASPLLVLVDGSTSPAPAFTLGKAPGMADRVAVSLQGRRWLVLEAPEPARCRVRATYTGAAYASGAVWPAAKANPLVLDSGQTVTPVGSWGVVDSGVTVPLDGIYAATLKVVTSSAVTGRSFLDLRTDTSGGYDSVQARASIGSGDDVGSVSHTNLRRAAGQPILGYWLHSSGADRGATFTLTATRISA